MAIQKYLSLIKFSHTIFALPFALIGFFMGMQSLVPVPGFTWITENGQPGLLMLFLLVLGCMVFARSAAMGFNRWLDARYDAMNPRTAQREIPAGMIRPNNALVFVVICSVLFVICTWFINRLCFYLSPVALGVILFYSYTKRFTALCHLVLGTGLSLAPIGAFIAVTGHFSVLPVLFSWVVLCWVSGFDIIYALQDEEFDRSQQLHSIPVWLGKSGALNLSRVLHLLAFGLVLFAGIYGGFGNWYRIGALLFGSLLLYQHLLVKPNDLSKVNLAFFTTNGVASVIFALLVIADLLILPHHNFQ